MSNERTIPHRMSAADRQRQLLEVALNAFSRRGFKGTTTKEIAAAAGVAEAVIFQHFPSKETLYSAVLELHLETEDEQAWIQEIDEFMKRNDDQALFRSFIRRILHSYRCDPLIHRVILFAALEGHGQGQARMQKQFAPILERFIEYISRRQREGALMECNPHAILISLAGIAHQYGLITQILHAPAPDAPDDMIAQLFTRILLHGVQGGSSAIAEDGSNPKSAEEECNRKAND